MYCHSISTIYHASAIISYVCVCVTNWSQRLQYLLFKHAVKGQIEMWKVWIKMVLMWNLHVHVSMWTYGSFNSTFVLHRLKIKGNCRLRALRYWISLYQDIFCQNIAIIITKYWIFIRHCSSVSRTVHYQYFMSYNHSKKVAQRGKALWK